MTLNYTDLIDAIVVDSTTSKRRAHYCHCLFCIVSACTVVDDDNDNDIEDGKTMRTQLVAVTAPL